MNTTAARRVLACLACGATLCLEAAATDCVAEATGALALNLSAGIYTEQARVSAPLTVKIPTGTDPERYAACLEIAGPDPSRAALQAVRDARDCRRQATRTRLVRSVPTAGRRIRAELDEAQYAACVAHDIEVEVEVPDSNPAAARP